MNTSKKPQTIKAAYSDNLNGNGDKYRSQRWSIELSRDLNENEDAGSVSRILFEIARAAVEREKRDQISVPGVAGDGNGTNRPLSQNRLPSNGNGRPATQKQLNYLFQLGKKTAHLSDEQIRALPGQYFGKVDLADLTSKEASQLIDTLAENKKAA